MIALGIIYAIVCMFRFSINAYQYLKISCYQQNICSMQYNGMQKKNSLVEMISAILMCFNATPCTLFPETHVNVFHSLIACGMT